MIIKKNDSFMNDNDEKWKVWIAFTQATEAAEVIIHDLMSEYRRLSDHLQELNEEGAYQ